MAAALFSSALIAPAAGGTEILSPAETGALYAGAQTEVHTALNRTYLLLTSSQAELTKLQWSFRRWGLLRQRSEARKHYRRFTDKIDRFRGLAESVHAQTSPMAAAEKKAAESKPVLTSKDKPAGSPGEVVAEIEALRSGFDADASRAALTRASSLIALLAEAWGPPVLEDEQIEVVLLANNLADDLRRSAESMAKSLPQKTEDRLGSHRKSRELVLAGLARMVADAEDLRTEIKRLRIHFQLNNYENHALRSRRPQ